MSQTITPVHTERGIIPKVPWGLSSVLGIVGVAGVIAGAIETNDTLTVVSGAGTLLSMLGRQGQAIAGTLRNVARAAKPWVDAAAAEYAAEPNIPVDGDPANLDDETTS